MPIVAVPTPSDIAAAESEAAETITPSGEVVYDYTSAASDPNAPRPFELRGEDLPSGRRARVRGMKGKDQRELELAFQRKETRDEAIFRLLCACVEDLDGSRPKPDAIAALHDADYTALVVRVAMASWPSKTTAEFAWECTERDCGGRNEQSVDLTALTYTPPHVAPEDPQQTLPVSGFPFTYEPVTHASTMRYQKMRRGRTEVNWDQIILSRNVMVDGERLGQAMIDAMEAADRAAIIDALSKTGGIEQAIVATCRHCSSRRKLSLMQAILPLLLPQAR